MSCSLRPSPYTSAVSKNVTPGLDRGVAARRSASASATSPQSAPSCQVPSPTTERAAGPAEHALFHDSRSYRIAPGVPGCPDDRVGR